MKPGSIYRSVRRQLMEDFVERPAADFTGRRAQGMPKPVQWPGVGQEQAAENVDQFTGGLPAGLAGMSGDIQSMGEAAGNAVMTGLGHTPVVGPMFNYLQTKMQGRSAPTSEEVGRAMGYDPESGAFQAGTWGAPDWSDLRRFPSALAMTLFHGTPHKFDRFDISKIGSGEGAQAYGWGLYFAESPGVAGQYATTLGQFDRVGINSLDIVPMPGVKVSESAHMNLDEYFDLTQGEGLTQARYDEAIADMQRRVDEFGESSLLSQSDIDELKGLSVRNFRPAKGHLYEIDIDDSVIDKMLDWDAPLSEQPEVLAALRDMPDAPIIERLLASNKFSSRKTLESAEGVEVYKALAEYYDEAKASQFLNEAGIPGIRFWDGNSRSAGEGTRNIVVFNPDDIKSVKRDGEMVWEAVSELGQRIGDRSGRRAGQIPQKEGYSTRFPTIKAFNDWKTATPDADPAKREIMYEVLQEQRAKVDAGALEKDGRPFGSPKGMTAEKREAMVNHYADRIERGLEAFPPGYFYREGRDTIRSLTPDPRERRVLAHQIDQTSSQVGPAENVNYTVRGREQRNAGLDVSTTIYPNKAREPFTAISEGREDFTGYKRDRYGNLLTPEKSRGDLPEGAEMAPNDRWEFRAAGFNTVPSDPKNVAYMDRFREDALGVVNARRAEAGQPPLTLEQAQEVHWAVIRAETEGRPLAMNRGNDQIGGAFDRLEYSHTYEAAPGRTSGHYPDMTPAQQRDLLGVFNEGGRDPLVDALGGDLQRPVRGHVGYYDGQYNPGQTARSFVSRTDSLGMDPSSAARVNTTEGIRSLALAQDAYAGNVFTPISNSKNPKFNGVNVNLGSKPTKAEVKTAVDLAATINPNMVVVDSPSGLRAWIPGDTSKKAQNQVQDFANELSLGRSGEVTYGKVDSDYLELDWKGGNATQNVLDIIDEAGAKGMSGIVAKADSPETRAILGKVADKYEELRSAGIGLPNEKLIGVLRTWADKGLPGVREMVRKGLAPAAVLGILGASQVQTDLLSDPGGA